jgi:hypothetical protein
LFTQLGDLACYVCSGLLEVALVLLEPLDLLRGVELAPLAVAVTLGEDMDVEVVAMTMAVSGSHHFVPSS